MGANNDVVAFSNNAIQAFNIEQNELIETLEASLYPGASHNSIKLAIGYCKASNLDPMQKPVHIVPIWDKNIGKMRDVIMPGVGLYRTQAARSGLYAGMTEAEFGPDVTENLAGVTVTFPQWARVVVKKLLPNGTIAEFSAKEYWKENYATAKRDTLQPNAMWKKRPYGQLAKCAEAQALRKAFPESVGSAPTAEEMEGRHAEHDMGAADEVGGAQQTQPQHGIKRKSDGDKQATQQQAEQQPIGTASEVIDGETGEIIQPSEPAQAAAAAKAQPATQQAQAASQRNREPGDDDEQIGNDSPPASAGLIKVAQSKVAAANLTDEAALAAHGLKSYEGMSTATANKIIAWAKANKQ
jgi:phage recombination protein Bet